MLRFSLILSLILYCLPGFGQKHDVSISYRVGFNHQSDNSNSILNSSYDNGVIVISKYRIWEKAKLYATIGYDKSVTNYEIYNGVFGTPERPYPFNVIKLKRNGMHLGINKKFKVKSLLFDVGINYSFRVIKHLSQTNSETGSLNGPNSLFRSFNFETMPYDLSGFGLDFNASVMYRLTDNLGVSMGFNYSRGHSMGYRSSAVMTDGVNITTSAQKKYFDIKHYLFFSLGINYLL